MSYSPYLPQTPQKARSNPSAPNTPRLGYRSIERPSPRHHYMEMLVQASDNHSDTCSNSALYTSPAHQRQKPTYGSLQTDNSNQSSVSMQTKQCILIADSATPSDEDLSLDQTTVMNRPIAWIWMIVNIIVFAVSLLSILQPFWLVNGETGASLGVLNHCPKIVITSTETDRCSSYDLNLNSARLLTLASLPWKVGLILCMMACILLGISSLMATLCLCISVISTKNTLSFIAGYQQLAAAILQLTALAVFPVGFDAQEVRALCGDDSSVYSLGDCSIGWSYLTMGACALISCILPVLSHYIHRVPPSPYHTIQQTQF